MKEKEKPKSFAKEILEDYKAANKRLFIILLFVVISWIGTIGYLVYVLQDIGTITTQEVTDFDTINGDITNG